MTTPLILITGFPGAGKTAFLKSVLPLLRKSGWSPSVIINDFENARSTAGSLASEAARIIPIEGGCICCDAREHFLNTISETPTSANSILLVEASPATEPIELLETLTIDRRTAKFSPPIQISIVDAMRWQRRQQGGHLEGMQVITAPYLVINRLPELKSTRRAKVELSIRSLNPFARPISAESFPAEIADLKSAPDPSDKNSAGGAADPPSGHRPGDRHFSTFQLPLAPQITRENLAAFLDSLPREIIRAKGIATLADDPDHTFLFQKIDGVKNIDFYQLEDGTRAAPLLICIGPNMPTASLTKSATDHQLASGIAS